MELTLAAVAERTGAPPEKLAEAHTLYRDATHDDPTDARPCDLFTLWPQLAGSTAASVPTGFDVTLASPCAERALSEPQVGAAAALADERKAKVEPALRALGAACYPLAMSTNGRFTDPTARFVHDLARRWGRACGWPPPVAHPRLKQNLSLAIHRANARLFAQASARADGRATAT